MKKNKLAEEVKEKAEKLGSGWKENGTQNDREGKIGCGIK
jgi:hypothetical protein